MGNVTGRQLTIDRIKEVKPSALHVLHHNFAITIRMVLSKNLLLLLEKISRKGLRRSGYIIYAEALYPKNVAGLKLRPKVRKEEGGLTTEMGPTTMYGHSVLNM